MLSMLLYAVVVTANPDVMVNPLVECAADDLACQREAYNRLKIRPAPSVDCDPDPSASEGQVLKGDQPRVARPRCSQTPAAPTSLNEQPDKPSGLPWYATAPAQWCAVLGLDLLPAVGFALTAVVLLLPAGTILGAVLAALSCACIPGLPCVEGVGTNLVGDLMSRGTLRGRLLAQVGVSAALLGLQLAAAVLGLGLTAVVVNVLAVKQVLPEARFVASACQDPLSDKCTTELGKVSTTSIGVTVAGVGGVLGIVAVNLLLAVVLKGPLLALAWQLHSTDVPPDPYPSFLPRLAQQEPPAPVTTEVASSARPDSAF